jgi:hypothetical protein
MIVLHFFCITFCSMQVMITPANVASMPSAEEMPSTNTPAAFSELELLVQVSFPHISKKYIRDV